MRATHPASAAASTPRVMPAGLEWDAPGRGKGDGSVTTSDGTVVRYFR
jgi:hypothetical protein